MAGTDKRAAEAPERAPAIVLVEPQLGENIGMAARAMANFGLSDLRLVAPRDGWPSERAIAAAAGADHVIETARLFDTLEGAIADLNLVFMTTARPRDMYKEVIGPEQCIARAAASIAAGQGAGLVMGRERWGLTNDEVALGSAIVTLPVVPGFGSLNLAQAVVVLAYEWRRAAARDLPPSVAGDAGTPAPNAEIIGLLDHLESTLDEAGFFPTPEKRSSMVNNLRAMLTRAGFNSQEVRTLRGVITSLERKRRDG